VKARRARALPSMASSGGWTRLKLLAGALCLLAVCGAADATGNRTRRQAVASAGRNINDGYYSGPSGGLNAYQVWDDEEHYVITEERLVEIRSEFMYPFKDPNDYQKDINDLTPQIDKKLNIRFPYYGFLFNYTWVSLHGFIGFSMPTSQPHTYPLTFPQPDWPVKNDPSFIGPFYSKCVQGEIGGEETDTRRPGVYYRIERDLYERYDQFGVELRERAKWDIREGIVGAEAFTPKHVIITTWKNVSFNGGNSNSRARSVTNTFQLVIATDEVRSYSMFNYLHMGWTTHTEAGGDGNEGQGGIPAYVGFNAGNGSSAYPYTPYSQTMYIRDLTSTGMANGFPGRHMFRIDEKILAGNCRHELYGSNLPLVFAPEQGNMLGGNLVNISGPCFGPNTLVKCRFYDREVEGVVRDTNTAFCVQPRLFATGYIDIAVSLDGGPYYWKGQYYVETPLTSAEGVMFASDDYQLAEPGSLKMQWLWHNLTMDQSAKVTISLYGYRESTNTPELVFIDTIAETNNDGEITVTTSDYMGNDNWDYLDIEVGLLQVNLTSPGTYLSGLKGSPVLWSAPIPLAWYFAPQWTRVYGSEWAARICNRWIENDRNLKHFAGEVTRCPCRVEQAVANKGLFVPDFSCDRDGNTACDEHKGAIHCVRAGMVNADGAGQQCCYDIDGYLMMTSDSMWGGNPHRAHNLGMRPFYEANKMPSLSHWFHDVAPFYSCCRWQGEQSQGCTTFRFERRASQDCVGYQPPSAATVFGDPHFYTYDDTEYTFNGKGEYVLTRVNTDRNKIDIQARFEQLPDNDRGPIYATHLTAIAARDNFSTTVEIRLRPTEAQWRYKLNVLVNRQYLYFDRYPEKMQIFRGMLVYVPTFIHNQSQVVVLFQSGAGIEVLENQGQMAVRAYLPLTFMNQTVGLFGNWSNDPSDDLVTPEGNIVTNDMNNMERVYNDFGLKWMLDDKEDPLKGGSLFYHENGRSSSNYYDPSFLPVFDQIPDIPDNSTLTADEVKRVCGDSYQCSYDFIMSERRDVAVFSKFYQDEFVNTKSLGLQTITSCGALPTPQNGRKNTFAFTPGTMVKFECDPGYILIGEARRWCYASGDWNWPEDGEVSCVSESQYKMMYAGIQTAIALSVLIPLIAALTCFYLHAVKNGPQNRVSPDMAYSYQPAAEPAEPRRVQAVPLQAGPHQRGDTDSGVSGKAGSSQMSTSDVDTTFSSGDGVKGVKEPQHMDGAYYTGEPLQGKPDVEFSDKPMDLEMPMQASGSMRI